MKRETQFTLLMIIFVFAITFGSAEALLRLSGIEPWRPVPIQDNEPQMAISDDKLGWIGKPGQHTLPAFSDEGESTVITILDDGSRKTAADNSESDNVLLVIGGSFSQGWGVNDEETYPWKLQSKYPQYKVINSGVSGYGTYQSLLTLENYLKNNPPPEKVIYGFIQHHERRNVATAKWLNMLSKEAKRGHVYVPYSTLDEEGKLVRHEPEAYPTWPLRQYSATITFLQDQYLDFAWRHRRYHRQLVTEQLLLEIKRVTEKYGSQLLVSLLDYREGQGDHYAQFLQENGFSYADCRVIATEDLIIKGDGHLNGKAQSQWASCMDTALTKINPSI